MSNKPLPSSFDGNTEFYEENRWEKLSRRLKEEPLIPLGCVLTCLALFGATRSIRAGDHNKTQRMFRARIYAQGFTLIAMLAGSAYWQSDRNKRKEFDAAVAERKAKEKNEAWIKELEARDEEEKMVKAAREARRKGVEPPKLKKGPVLAGKGEDVEDVEDVVQKQAKEGKGAASEIDESETKRSVLESVQDLVWGKKK